MKMRDRAGRGGNFAPAVTDYPANELARALVVAPISPKRAKEQKHRVNEGVDLMPQRFSRAEQISADFPINFQDERRLWFMVGVIRRQKVGEQLPIREDRIDRSTEKAGCTTKI